MFCPRSTPAPTPSPIFRIPCCCWRLSSKDAADDAGLCSRRPHPPALPGKPLPLASIVGKAGRHSRNSRRGLKRGGPSVLIFLDPKASPIARNRPSPPTCKNTNSTAELIATSITSNGGNASHLQRTFTDNPPALSVKIREIMWQSLPAGRRHNPIQPQIHHHLAVVVEAVSRNP